MLASIKAWLVAVLRRIAENEALDDPGYSEEVEVDTKVDTNKDAEQQVMQGSAAQCSPSQEGGAESTGNRERPWSSSA